MSFFENGQNRGPWFIGGQGPWVAGHGSSSFAALSALTMTGWEYTTLAVDREAAGIKHRHLLTSS